MATKPITPGEASKRFNASIPDEVIESFNTLIARNCVGGRAKFKQDELIDLILSKMANETRREIFEKRWLDVEEVYNKVGWKVDYAKPGFNENFDAFFIFTAKKSRE